MISVDMNENISSLANQLDNVKENSVESPTCSTPIDKHEGAVFENINHSSPLSSSADSFHPSIIAVKSSDLADKNVNIASSEAEIIFNNAVGNHPPFVPYPFATDKEQSDAVEFFKDPSAMQYLETAGSASGSDLDITVCHRSSLYVKFDPLHLKYELQKQNAALDDSDKTSSKNSESPEVQQNKRITACIRESLGNLLSFDSPQKLPQSKTPIIKELSTEMYTEEELQQILNYVIKTVVEECLLLPRELSDENKKLKEENELLKVEYNKIKDDLKVVTEDLQSVENTFANYHKRYVQCKRMLKTYKENEECLKLEIADLKKQLVEQEEKYHLLQGRAEEAIDKVNSELSATSKTAVVQVAVLKAQLNKSQFKNETQARDLKNVRSENDQLKEMYDELVAKFSAYSSST